MREYVAGFLISGDSSQVALIKKARPAWQAGRLNAIGGKIEAGEKPLFAMHREFEEETGLDIPSDSWENFACISGPEWKCFFYRAWGDPNQCRTVDESEPIVVLPVSAVKLMPRHITISNIPWLLSLALNTEGGIELPVKINYL